MSMPTDNGKDFFIYDFYKRTLQLLNDYRGEYDVTMLLNSSLGLLVVPKGGYFNYKGIPDTFVSADMLLKLQKCIKVNTSDGKENSDKSLQNIVRHMRNSIAHARMTIHGEEPNVKGKSIKITCVEFEDEGKRTIDKKKVEEHFKADITIDLLKDFVIEFATNECKDYENKKQFGKEKI